MSLATPVRVRRGYLEVMARETGTMTEHPDGDTEILDAFIMEEKRQIDAIGDLWKWFIDTAKDGDWQDYQEFAEAFQGLFEQADASLANLRQSLDRFRESTGKTPGNADLVEQAARTLEEWKAKIVPELDWFTAPMQDPDPHLLDQAIAEGGGIDIRDIIRELQGNYPSNGSPADR